MATRTRNGDQRGETEISESAKRREPGFRYRYRWAMDLFEQFSIHAPQNDFLPNVTPSFYKLPNGTPLSPPPDAVSNSGGVAGNSEVRDLKGGAIDYSNDYAEDLQPVEGLVNINTAPWKVLAALPMVLNDDGTVNAEQNTELAKAIVYYRDVDSGFGSGGTATPSAPHGSVHEHLRLERSRWIPAGRAAKIQGEGARFPEVTARSAPYRSRR